MHSPQDDTRSYSRAKRSISRLRGLSRNPLIVSSEPKRRMVRFIRNVENHSRSDTCPFCSSVAGTKLAPKAHLATSGCPPFATTSTTCADGLPATGLQHASGCGADHIVASRNRPADTPAADLPLYPDAWIRDRGRSTKSNGDGADQRSVNDGHGTGPA